MSLIVTNSQNYTNIANAIRTVNKTNTTYKPMDMPNAILDLAGDWMGKKPEFIKQVYALDTTLDETNYATWTPSTTAATIFASQTLSDKEVLDMENYDYVLYWVSDCNVAYDNTWVPIKGTCLREISVYTQALFRRPTSVADTENEILNYNATQQDTVFLSWCKYYSSNTAISVNSTTYSPCYMSSISAPTFNSTSSVTPTVTIKTPVLSARCNATYFATGQAAKVDQENTTVKMNGYLYRVNKSTSVCSSMWKILLGVYNHPL